MILFLYKYSSTENKYKHGALHFINAPYRIGDSYSQIMSLKINYRVGTRNINHDLTSTSRHKYAYLSQGFQITDFSATLMVSLLTPTCTSPFLNIPKSPHNYPRDTPPLKYFHQF
jgi:hypothetical protein